MAAQVADGAALLRGAVRSHDGWPVPEAVVTVLGPAGTQVGRAGADDDGRFSLALPEPGAVTLVVAAPGVRPAAVAAIVRNGSVTDVGVVALEGATRGVLPPPGVYDLDPAHTMVRATARHLGLSRVEGRFTAFRGSLVVGERPEESAAEVVIEAASITTGNDDRDTHLRSADFLDVERFPELAWRSAGVTHVERPDGSAWRVEGDLTIRDITRPVPLDVEFLGTGQDAWGGRRIAFAGQALLHRRDYEIRWNMGLPGGLTVLGPTLKIELDVQAVRREE